MRPFLLTSLAIATLATLASAQRPSTLEAEPRAEAPIQAAAEEEPAAPKTKIPAAVRDKATQQERIRIALVLSEAGDSQALDAVKSRYRDRIRSADTRAHQFAGERERKSAAAERDSLRKAERQEIRTVRKAEFKTQQDTLSSRIAVLGGKVLERYWLMNVLYVEVPAAALSAIESDPDVIAVRELSPLKLYLGNSTTIMGAPAFWDAGIRGGTQVAAVIDSGIAAHSGFANLKITPFSLLEGAVQTGCADATKPLGGVDEDGHGTHVAGIIAAQSVPGVDGATGVAPGIASLVTVRVGATGNGSKSCPDLVISGSDVLNAIQFVATETPATVANLSLGGETRLDDDLVNWVLDEAADKLDVVFVIAAGNSGREPIPYQLGNIALSYNGITVANIDTKGTRTRTDDVIAPSSSRGPTRLGRRKPDVAAPGTNIASLFLRDEVVSMSGTSMAAPHVTGAVALLLDSGVDGAKAAKALLLNSTDRSGWSRDWGWGGVDLESAYRQRNWIENKTIAASAARYYRMSVAGSTRATLVWNRRITGINPDSKSFFGDFRDLNLSAFDETSNRLVDSSSSKIDNVEQIGLKGEGMALVKVFHNSTDRGNEPFALAFSTGEYEEVKPGQLSLRCTAPNEVSATMRYPVNCTLANEGSLPVFGLNFRAVAPTGFQGTSVSPVERIRPGQQITFRYDLIAPITAVGSVQYSVQVTGAAYGDEHRVVAPLQTTFRVPKPQDCSVVATPASGTLVLQSNAQSFVLKLQFPRYNPQEPGVCAWTVTEYETFTQVSGVRTGVGDGEVTVNVAASNANRLYQTRRGDLTISVGTARFAWNFQQYYKK